LANDDYDSEQRDMISEREIWGKKIKNRKRELGLRRGGTKFLGDVAVRILAHHLERRVPNLKFVRGPAFVLDAEESEFDLLVVDKDATRAEFTNAFPQSEVCSIIEVKGVGLICKKLDVETRLRKAIIETSKSLDLPVLYLSFVESKSYIEEVRKALGDNAFILARAKGTGFPEPLAAEWKRFVNRVLELPKSRNQ
jgi:hypothetical protein